MVADNTSQLESSEEERPGEHMDENEGSIEMTSTNARSEISTEDENNSVTAALMHQRIDCLDEDKNWYASTVVAVNEDAEEIKVRFDGYKSGFDEWINYNDEYRIKPVYSVVPKPQLELVVATLLHSAVRKKQGDEQSGMDLGLEMVSDELNSISPSKNNNNDNDEARYFGTPSLLYFSSHVSNEELLNIVDQHLSNCIKESKINKSKFRVKYRKSLPQIVAQNASQRS